MTKDYLTALVDITKKLKLSPKDDIQAIKNSYLLKPPKRKPSSSNLLEEVTEYALRRRPSRDNIQIDSSVLKRKVSTHTTLSHVRECEEDGTCELEKKEHDVTTGLSLLEKLDYVKKTLNEIRQHDQDLARQFLHTYAEAKRAKVRQSCIIHQDMLDDVFSDEVQARQTPNVCDAPLNKRSSMALRQCGVTRMNITSKRFSCS
ncbi:hypothetical protein FSP39_013883 [Pinctada imbricata]|uniref:Uncharacterized protein n=1 Tax=Pinctada imbricata TaxID=66713 RepID=A0AA88XMA3_PINIB|nr:hypothetical protein FSP39_013883 [Pinctada imbricata]